MAHEVETMFSGRGIKPWHFDQTGPTGQTVVVDGAPTAAEAIKLAQLDWDVELRKVYAGSSDGKSKKLIPSKQAVVRATDDKVFSVVGSVYQPLQNKDAFTFMDNLVDEGLEYETAGSLRGGSIVFLTAKLPGEILVGGEDAHELYLFLRSSHNGFDSIKVGITPIRVVCQNTLNMALGRQKRSWAVAHTSTMQGKLQEAREALALTWKYMDIWKDTAETLIGTALSDSALDAFLAKCTEDFAPKPRETAITGMKSLLDNSPTCEPWRNNAWGAYNAVGEYFEWVKPTTGEARMMGNIQGQSQKMRDRALGLLVPA